MQIFHKGNVLTVVRCLPVLLVAVHDVVMSLQPVAGQNQTWKM